MECSDFDTQPPPEGILQIPPPPPPPEPKFHELCEKLEEDRRISMYALESTSGKKNNLKLVTNDSELLETLSKQNWPIAFSGKNIENLVNKQFSDSDIHFYDIIKNNFRFHHVYRPLVYNIDCDFSSNCIDNNYNIPQKKKKTTADKTR